MERTIYKEKIPSTDSRLNRHINHDSRSKDFTFDTSNLQIIDVEHKRLIPVLDQGQVGSCTGNAGIGCINTEPFSVSSVNGYSPDEQGALKLYSDAEIIDGDGPYPPNDNGSSGLSIAKALKNTGIISGYQHTFTLNDALKALSVYPIMTGMNWYQGMDVLDADGRAHPTGAIRGGHEVQAFKVDTKLGRIWFYNSWGTNWGINGTFYLTWADYYQLLLQNGDVTILIPAPIVPPAPMPTPGNTIVTITRTMDDGIQALGDLNIGSFNCKTLERPWKNNQVNISCIPKGTYHCSYTFSLSHLGWTYAIQNVPGRSGIRIHSANYYTDLEGCIGLGSGYKDINNDREVDIINSKATVAAFIQALGKKDFTLIIK